METRIFVCKVGSFGSANVISAVCPYFVCVFVYKLKGNKPRELQINYQLFLSTINYLEFWTLEMSFPLSIYKYKIRIAMLH